MADETEVATLPDPTSPEFDVDPAAVEPDEDEGEEVAEGDAPVEAVVEEPEPEPVDWAIDYDGKPYPIPGVKFNAKHRQLAAAEERDLERLQTWIRHGIKYQDKGGYRDTIHRQAKELEQERATIRTEIEQANVFHAEFMKLMDPAMADDDAVALFHAIRQNWPIVERDAKIAALEKRNAGTAKPVESDDPPYEALEEWGREALVSKMGDVAKGLPWMTEGPRKHIVSVLTDSENLGRFVRRADRDYPEYGLTAGQWAVDWNRVQKAFDALALPYIEAHEARTAAAKQVETLGAVAKTNAKILGTGTPPKPAPTAPPARRSPAPDPAAAADAERRRRIAEADREFVGR